MLLSGRSYPLVYIARSISHIVQWLKAPEHPHMSKDLGNSGKGRRDVPKDLAVKDSHRQPHEQEKLNT